ncbi:hypothetical protein NX907_14545 [Burkholderia thailandensis]|uniref:hypothetical protein n=1 Tax=Burkholderia thailandensis TaxID=57975 RepID=UPI00217D22E8|nr:hypothetical protein [Burkholderia thailandensis]MCS6495606.1 hypothetical protein [Burkholderia thailandensis]MCS6506827.1 hypothetical protein [Burkholderia thailandensis]
MRAGGLPLADAAAAIPARLAKVSPFDRRISSGFEVSFADAPMRRCADTPTRRHADTPTGRFVDPRVAERPGIGRHTRGCNPPGRPKLNPPPVIRLDPIATTVHHRRPSVRSRAPALRTRIVPGDIALDSAKRPIGMSHEFFSCPP